MEPGTGVDGPPGAAYSCPHSSRKMMPRSGFDPGTMWPCSRSFPRCATKSCPEASGLELLLWTAEPAFLRASLGYIFEGILAVEDRSRWVIPTCPPDCDLPDKHYPWSCRGVLTCMGVDDACPHHVADGMVCRAEEQSQRWDNRSTKVGYHMHHCRNLLLFCMLHGCDPSRGRLGELFGCSPL